MISTRIILPSKTFLLGEYLSLSGGPVLILNTSPYFTFTADKKVAAATIESYTPAGRYIQKYRDFFAEYAVDFYDPHHGKGGFGASSAQFAAVSLFKQLSEQQQDKVSVTMLFELLQEYQACAWNGTGPLPSGMDVMAQYLGSQHQSSTTIVSPLEKVGSLAERDEGFLCLIDSKRQQVDGFAWPFADIAFFLLRTGYKVSTHEHLQSLQNIPTIELGGIMQTAMTAINNKDSILFCSAVNEYATCLDASGFVISTTQQILKKLQTQSWVAATKGCGALGADVILVLTATCDRETMLEWAGNEKLDVVAWQ